MRVAACADVHLGNPKRFGGEVKASLNHRCRLALDVLRRAVDRAMAHECDAFLVVGDLLDYARPEAQLLAAVQRECARLEDGGCEVFLLGGNHEQASTTPGDHALAPLAPYATVVDKPLLVRREGWEAELLLVPFQPGRASEWFPAAVRGITGGREEGAGTFANPKWPRLLAFHLGVRDDETAPWLRAAADAVDIDLVQRVCARAFTRFALAGNWHDRRQWHFDGVPGVAYDVMQLGALVPTGWDNPGLGGYGTLALWDSAAGGSLDYEELAGPRFLKAANIGDVEGALTLNRELGHRLYVSETVDPVDVAVRAGHLQELVGRGLLEGAEAVPDLAVAEAAARMAATHARKAETVEQALAAYVGAMPLADGVSRDKVLERVRSYIK